MRLALIVAVGGALAVAPVAEAAFVARAERVVGTGSATTAPLGHERVFLIVGETNPTLTIGAVDLTMSTPGTVGGLKFNASVDDDTVEYLGQQSNNSRRPNAFANTPNSLTFASLPGAFANIEAPDVSAPGAVAAYAAGLSAFSNASAYEGAPRTFNNATATPPITSANGIIIGSAVVPTGTTVLFTGQIDDDLSATTGIQTFNVLSSTIVPEPTTLAALAGAAALGLARRRR